MTKKWSYSHAGHVFGPYNADEMRLLAAIGLLLPDDLLWPEGGRRDAVEARSAIDFATLPPPRLAPPEWLADVERLERAGPEQIEWPLLGTPDWLDDIRQVESPADKKPMVPQATGNQPVPTSVSELPGQSRAPENLPSAPELPSVSRPSPPPRETEPGVGRPAGEVGTEQESLPYLWRRAQSAIHAWADMDINKALILSGDCEALRRDIAIRVILRLVERGGPSAVERLWKHLEFVVENRRNYYRATG